MFKKIFTIGIYAIYTTINTILFRNVGKIENSSKTLPILASYMLKLFITSLMRFPSKPKFNMRILFAGFLFIAQNVIMWKYMVKLDPIHASVCFHSKFIFLFIFSIFLLKKKFTNTQILGQFFIFIGVIFPNVYSCMNAGSKKHAFDIIYAIWIIAAGCFNALSSIFFELKIKKDVKNIWTYNFDYSIHCIGIIVPIVILEYFICKPSYAASLQNYKFYITIFLSSLGSIGTSYLAMIFCPVRRSFVSNFVSMFSNVFASLMPNEEFKVINLVAMIISYSGGFLYEFKNIKKTILNKDRKKKDANLVVSETIPNGCGLENEIKTTIN